MLNQKVFGEKLRHHRKRLGFTQEEVASKIGVSAQAISKWEAGDCMPDCFNLKAISDVYHISVDVLLETETDGNIDAVANKIEQLGTEFIWANASIDCYSHNAHQELGEDLWKMWKGLYFAETGDRDIQEKSKQQGNLRIIGPFGMKIWDDDGVVCVVKSSLIRSLSPAEGETTDVLQELCTKDGQTLILALSCDAPITKAELIEKTGVELARLNELLLLFTENRIIEFENDHRSLKSGYLISGHRGIAAYMILAATHILKKPTYTVSQYLKNV